MSDLFDALRIEAGLPTLAELIERPAWMRDALCAEPQYPTSWWFATSRSNDAAQAVSVCRRCAVRNECLAWALESGPDLVGIWGGASHRRRLRLLTTTDRAA